MSVDYICPFDLLTIPCLAYRTDQVDLTRSCYSSMGLTRERYSGFYPMSQLRLVVVGEIADFRLDRKKRRGLKYQEIFRQFYSPDEMGEDKPEMAPMEVAVGLGGVELRHKMSRTESNIEKMLHMHLHALLQY